jgi:ADP-ribosylglycohydrolase
LDDRRAIRDLCRITHRNDEAYVGALAVIRAIRWAVHGLQIDRTLIDHLVQALPDSNVRDRFAIIKDERMTASAYRKACVPTGYVADSVPFAILISIDCVGLTFLDSMRSAVEIGGDTDTICSMVGQIRGACSGMADIPSIAEEIEDVGLIREVAAAFARTVNAM